MITNVIINFNLYENDIINNAYVKQAVNNFMHFRIDMQLVQQWEHGY